jgi:hypothetical protein
MSDETLWLRHRYTKSEALCPQIIARPFFTFIESRKRHFSAARLKNLPYSCWDDLTPAAHGRAGQWHIDCLISRKYANKNYLFQDLRGASMKLMILGSKIAATLLLLASTSAFACPHSVQQFICPGDRVVDHDAFQGRVIAVNRFEHMASVMLDSGAVENEEIQTLAVAAGCLEAFCMGDKVVDGDAFEGRVIAVNPNTRELAIMLDSGVVELEKTDLMTVSYGCTLGYCVGDTVIDADTFQGSVIALSPYKYTAAVMLDSGVIVNERVKSLSSTRTCDEYNNSQRSSDRYPIMPRARYLTPEFHYYSSRK